VFSEGKGGGVSSEVKRQVPLLSQIFEHGEPKDYSSWSLGRDFDCLFTRESGDLLCSAEEEKGSTVGDREGNRVTFSRKCGEPFRGRSVIVYGI